MRGLLGVVVLLAIAFAASTDRRRAVNPRILLWGFGLQIAIALFAMRTAVGVRLFMAANDLANDFLAFADAGIHFVFGDWPALTMVQTPSPEGGVHTVAVGFLLAAKVLPIIIASFALCGFANFGSLAIVLGGLGGMVPERRKDLARLGLKSILAGSLATFLTGTLAGLIAP